MGFSFGPHPLFSHRSAAEIEKHRVTSEAGAERSTMPDKTEGESGHGYHEAGRPGTALGRHSRCDRERRIVSYICASE
jgi:hypothetical protein